MFRKLWLGLCLLAFAAMMFLLSSHANAEETYTKVSVHTVGVHVGSKHWPQAEWNNVNPGVYLRGSINSSAWAPNGDYVVGSYYNSERRQSAYVGYIVPVAPGVDVIVGGISGYRRATILPMVVPSVHFPLVDNWSARVSFLPKVEKSGANVMHLSLERKF